MEKDLALSRYLADNHRYADLLNGFGFGGKQIIAAEDLSEQDVQTGFWSDSAQRRKSRKKQQKKYRDLIRKVAFGVNFVL